MTRTLSCALATLFVLCLVARADGEAGTVEGQFPDLFKGPIATATFGELPAGTIVRYDGGTLLKSEVDRLIALAAPDLRPDLERNALFIAQELVTRRLLLADARAAATKRGKSIANLTDAKLISEHLQDIAADVPAATEAEISQYYAAHPEQFDGKALRKVHDDLATFLYHKKRQDRVNEYVRALGAAYHMVLAQDWGLQHAKSAADNPIYKARRSGLPSMIQWSAADCKPCHKMAPDVAAVAQQFAGRANVVTVMADELRSLATRYAIHSTPTQIFFDASGNERHRNTTPLSRKEMVEELQKIGVR